MCAAVEPSTQVVMRPWALKSVPSRAPPISATRNLLLIHPVALVLLLFCWPWWHWCFWGTSCERHGNPTNPHPDSKSTSGVIIIRNKLWFWNRMNPEILTMFFKFSNSKIFCFEWLAVMQHQLDFSYSYFWYIFTLFWCNCLVYEHFVYDEFYSIMNFGYNLKAVMLIIKTHG